MKGHVCAQVAESGILAQLVGYDKPTQILFFTTRNSWCIVDERSALRVRNVVDNRILKEASQDEVSV